MGQIGIAEQVSLGNASSLGSWVLCLGSKGPQEGGLSRISKAPGVKASENTKRERLDEDSRTAQEEL